MGRYTFTPGLVYNFYISDLEASTLWLLFSVIIEVFHLNGFNVVSAQQMTML